MLTLSTVGITAILLLVRSGETPGAGTVDLLDVGMNLWRRMKLR